MLALDAGGDTLLEIPRVDGRLQSRNARIDGLSYLGIFRAVEQSRQQDNEQNAAHGYTPAAAAGTIYLR